MHLAPPLIAKTNQKGELVKQKFGSYMFTAFRLLAPLKFLRGTALDVFGRTEERRTERVLIAEYRTTMEELLEKAPENWYLEANEARARGLIAAVL